MELVAWGWVLGKPNAICAAQHPTTSHQLVIHCVEFFRFRLKIG